MTFRPSGKSGAQGGTRLTPAGRQFLKQYWAFRRGFEDMVSRRFERAFKRRRRAAASQAEDATHVVRLDRFSLARAAGSTSRPLDDALGNIYPVARFSLD